MRIKHYILGACTLALAIALTACDETTFDIFNSPLQETTDVSATSDQTVSSLTFTWDAVDGCNQYGYKLTNPDGDVVRDGLVEATTVTFTRLTSSTTYTLDVEAYGANGQPTQHFQLTATTADIVPLASPQSMNTVQANGRVTVSWDQVPNAQYYEYVVCNAEDSQLTEGTTQETSVNIPGLAMGTYKITVWANSDDEAFSRSEAAALEFVRTRELLYTKDGIYNSFYLGDRATTLEIYEDGTNIIKNYCGVEGYNLEFAIAADGAVTMLNSYYDWGKYRFVATGLASPTDYISVYEDPLYCYYYEDEDGKHIEFFCYYGDDDYDGGYDMFTWDIPEKNITIDSFIGTYSMTYFYCDSFYWFPCSTMTEWASFDNTISYKINIIKIDDERLEIQGLGGLAETEYFSAYAKYDCVYATVDLEAMTINIESQNLHAKGGGKVYKYFGIGLYNEDDLLEGTIVGTYDDKLNITLNGWGTWYDYYMLANTLLSLSKD